MPMMGVGPTTEAQLRRKAEQERLQLDLAQQSRANEIARQNAMMDEMSMRLRLAQQGQNNQEAAAYNQIARLNAANDVARMKFQASSDAIRASQTEVPSAYMTARRLLGY